MLRALVGLFTGGTVLTLRVGSDHGGDVIRVAAGDAVHLVLKEEISRRIPVESNPPSPK